METIIFLIESSLATDIEPTINSVLRYPSVERNQKKIPKAIDLSKHMTTEDAPKILKAKEAENRHLDIATEAKCLQKAAALKKHQKPMNSSNESKGKSAWARKLKKFDDFLLSSEDSTSESDSTITEEEEIIIEEERDESEEEN